MSDFEEQLLEKARTMSTQELLDMYRDRTLTVDTYRVILAELQNRGVSAAQFDDPNYNPGHDGIGGNQRPVMIGWIVGGLLAVGFALLYFMY